MGKRVNCFKCASTDARWAPYHTTSQPDGCWLCKDDYQEVCYQDATKWEHLHTPGDALETMRGAVSLVSGLQGIVDDFHPFCLISVSLAITEGDMTEMHVHGTTLLSVSNREEWEWKTNYQEDGSVMNYRSDWKYGCVRLFALWRDPEQVRELGYEEVAE